MNLASIEAFLTVAETESLSQAAQQLFLSQSTVSYRIHELESELGVVLLLRDKGQRVTILSEQGVRFVPIARRWMSLNADTLRFGCQPARESLAVGCVDSLSLFILAPFYQKLLAQQQTQLTLATHASPAIYAAIQHRALDIGLVTTHRRCRDTVTTPLFEEQMILVTLSGQDETVPPLHPDQLDPHKEIFLSWGENYQLWHDSWFDPLRDEPYVTITAPSLFASFLRTPSCWAVAPASVADALAAAYSFRRYRLEPTPPNRVCYQVVHREPRSERRKAIEAFQRQLIQFLGTLGLIKP